MRTLDPDLLRTFLAVAAAPSYADAGGRVNKTQSTVSMQMRRLEETVGVALFEKRGRRNEITPAGRELLEYAERIVRLNDEAIGRFLAPRIAGRLRIGIPDDYAETFLPDIFGRFAATHPTIEIEIDCRCSDELIGRVEGGELDLAIVTMNGRYRGARILFEEELVWTSAPDRLVEDVRPLPLAVWQPGCAWRALTIQSLDEAGIDYRIAYTGSSGIALGLTVRAGLAVSAMPRRFTANGLRILPPGDPLPRLGSFEIGMVRAEGADGEAVEAFVEHTAACFRALASGIVRATPGNPWDRVGGEARGHRATA